MLYYLLAAGIVLHAFFWGAGLAWLGVPRPWRHWWWAFAPGLGLGLQSAVVWLGAQADLPGARSYAWTAEAVPIALLVAAFFRAGGSGVRRRLRELRGAAAIVVLGLAAGWMLLSPMAAVSRGLTTISLGSSDQADHAAGARVLQEFSSEDRVGFLDQPEVTEIHGVKSFFEQRLKFGAFIPEAVIAHDGALFGVEPRRMVGVMAVALVLCQLPLAFVGARAVFRLRGTSVGVAAIAGFSPLVAYAVHHGALGVLGAAVGLTVLTLAVVGLGRAALTGRSGWCWLVLLLAGGWLTAGSDERLLPWSLGPGMAWVMLEALRRAQLHALGRVLVVVVVAAELLAVGFWDRIDGLIRQSGAGAELTSGWPMPRLTPEAWLGFVSGVGLEPRASGARAGILGLVALGWLVGLVLFRRGRPGVRSAALAVVGSIAVGSWSVATGDARPHAHFEAWQFATAFLPVFLAGVLAVFHRPRLTPAVHRLALVVVTMLVVVNLVATDRFRRRMANPPLRVDRALVDLGALEAEPRVSSVNMRIGDPWARLWANTFLLRKPQYFPKHEYAARRATELRGEWDLSDSPLWARPSRAEDFIAVNRRFHAVRVAAADRIEPAFSAAGWYQEERGGDRIWRWSDGTGDIELTNPRVRPQRASLTLQLRPAQACLLRVELDGREIASRALGESVEAIEIAEVVLPPGRSRLALRIDRPPISPPGDGRKLAVALYEFELESRAATN